MIVMLITSWIQGLGLSGWNNKAQYTARSISSGQEDAQCSEARVLSGVSPQKRIALKQPRVIAAADFLLMDYMKSKAYNMAHSVWMNWQPTHLLRRAWMCTPMSYAGSHSQNRCRHFALESSRYKIITARSRLQKSLCTLIIIMAWTDPLMPEYSIFLGWISTVITNLKKKVNYCQHDN
jgi:hypothetical protein